MKRIKFYWKEHKPSEYIFAAGMWCCVFAMIAWTAVLIASWWGGTEGEMNLMTNHLHERLFETIFFAVLSGIGITWIYKEYFRKGK